VKPETPLEPSNPSMNVSAAITPPLAVQAVAPAAPPRARSGPADERMLAEERALVERARKRDEGAFRMLVDLHRDHAYGLALRITRSATDAEDVAQEAFVRAWAALPGFRGESRFGTWLHSIVARRALDRAETLRARRNRETDLDAVAEPSAPSPAFESSDPLLARRLEKLMGVLSAPQRAVVALFYGRDHSVEDVAATLAMNENTVKTHLARARSLLREAWLRESGGAS
jgi:RNA polymerase sigma-70 factor (ECF subfamily)